MELVVQRVAPFGQALPGSLTVDGRFGCFTLERVAVAIAAGRYPLLVTSSARAERNELWTPDREQFRLPLIADVPGRTGLRIHALNDPHESDGCIGVGKRAVPGRILDSRLALTGLLFQLLARPSNESQWITIVDPLKESPKSA